MILPFIIEHSVTREENGSTKIELFKVYLSRSHDRKTYKIHHYTGEGYILREQDKNIRYEVKDLFLLRYLNVTYLREQTVQVTHELINAIEREHPSGKKPV